MEKKKITSEMREELRKGFPEEAYTQHPTKTFLTTLKAMYVIERLNDVLGIGRWSVVTEVIERTDKYITLKGVFESLDYEIIVSPQFGGHTTVGTNVEIADGFKSATTDCISKIASHLEIGIDMFKGKINTYTNPKSGTPAPKKDVAPAKVSELTQDEMDNKWNGKVYTGGIVYIGGVKTSVSEKQIEELKNHSKYQK